MLLSIRILCILSLAITALEPFTLLARQNENDFPEPKRNPRLALRFSYIYCSTLFLQRRNL